MECISVLLVVWVRYFIQMVRTVKHAGRTNSLEALGRFGLLLGGLGVLRVSVLDVWIPWLHKCLMEEAAVPRTFQYKDSSV